MKVVLRKAGNLEAEFLFRSDLSEKQEFESGSIRCSIELVKSRNILRPNSQFRLRIYRENILVNSYTVFGYMEEFEIDE